MNEMLSMSTIFELVSSEWAADWWFDDDDIIYEEEFNWIVESGTFALRSLLDFTVDADAERLLSYAVSAEYPGERRWRDYKEAHSIVPFVSSAPK